MGIAGTGMGKSLTFELLAALPGSSHIIISPIRGLVDDQARALRRHGLTAIGLTGNIIEAYGPSLWRDVASEMYQYVVSSPEVLLNPESDFWKNMVRRRDSVPFSKALRSITVDQCHMVWKWGGLVDAKTLQPFRASFKHIGKFRLLFPDVPFLLLSATVTPVVQGYLFQVMKLQAPSVIARTSIQRSNLQVIFSTTQEAKRSMGFSELDFLIRDAAASGELATIEKTMVYTDERSRCQDIVKYLRNSFIDFLSNADQASSDPGRTPPSLADQKMAIAPYTGIYTADTNGKRLQDLKDGTCRVLVCTEAAGM